MTGAAVAPFEARYRAEGDPWRTLTDRDELRKARRVVAACGRGPFRAAVDLGCGIGTLAAGLAPRCTRLVAVDGAPSAVAAARERLAPWPGASARVGVLPGCLVDEPVDLVVAGEVLYYLRPDELDAVAGWIEGALRAGGRLVAAHWTGDAGDLRQSAIDVHARLDRIPGLTAVPGVEHGPTYLLDAWTRT